MTDTASSDAATAAAVPPNTPFVLKILPIGEDAFAIPLADGRVQLAENGETITAKPHLDGLLSAAATLDGKALITGGEDGRIVRVERDGSFQELHQERGKWIDRVAAGPDGAVAFSSGRDAVVLRGNDPVRRFQHQRSVNGLAFAPKGYRLATAHVGGVSLWWAGRDVEPTILPWEGAHLECIFSPDGRYVVTSMNDNQLHGWRLSDAQSMRMAGYPAKTKSFSWTAKGDYLASSGAQAAVLWPFKSKDGPLGKQPVQLSPRDSLVTQICCHPTYPMTAVGYADGQVQIVENETNRMVEMRAPDGDPISALGFNKRGALMALGTEGGYIGVHSMNQNQGSVT